MCIKFHIQMWYELLLLVMEPVKGDKLGERVASCHNSK